MLKRITLCNKKKEHVDRKSLFCLLCTRENELLGYRCYSWVPRVDCVTGLRTRNWSPSRTSATGLSLPCLPSLSSGSCGHAWCHQVGQGCVIKSWPQGLFGRQFSEQGTLGRPTIGNVSVRDNTYCAVKSATEWYISVLETACVLASFPNNTNPTMKF